MTHWNEIEKKHNTLVLLLRNRDILTYLEAEDLLTEKYKKEQLDKLQEKENESKIL